MFFVEQIKIVKVAANFFRRVHRRIQLELRSIKVKIPRQHRLLYVGRNVELRRNPFLVGCDTRQIRHIIFQLRRHLVKTDRQMLDLVARLDVKFFVEIAARDLSDAIRQLMDRIDKLIGQIPPDSRQPDQQHKNGRRHQH